ncbi:hypothetical protein H9Y05_00690 [Crocinitomicaceae bacterium CZZ-1]|uniref:Uncharacterized protein n=1 Tax=Taishania pollutisoli TaxID=2766479 RepID=A0A8J6P6Z8_9FLAO|nr:hypothetical protein [Taishania pollutisoli]MBC9810981.1 hypothetical protein [Taishania pollutisoli]MBX2950138.1 hypothetical protein [Crocinitomicaceae bacterium]NGF76619.1 hypothetical protein [Fluviicola sp. SGL-29]
MEARNAIVEFQGDNGGSLMVFGKAAAQLIYCTTYFKMEFPGHPNAYIIAEGHDFMFDVDLDELMFMK